MNKVAIVTGASKGIGYAICQLLLKEGWIVYGISRSQNDVLVSNNNFHQVIFDLQNTNKIPELVNKLPNDIDLLINNAGLWELVLLKDVTGSHFDKTIN
jgi:NAD(P)-dependent dehydrogenase (short-subunit alcohol dehydrogenase family)